MEPTGIPCGVVPPVPDEDRQRHVGDPTRDGHRSWLRAALLLRAASWPLQWLGAAQYDTAGLFRSSVRRSSLGSRRMRSLCLRS